jgi:serine/threonine-protein kinase
LTELALLQQREYPIRLDEIAPEVPAALALAVERALALEPRQRYEDAEAMRRALHDGARGIAPSGSGGPRGAGDADATAATSMISRQERTAPARRASTPPPPRVAKRLQPQPPPGGLTPVEYEPIPDIPPSRRDREPPRKKSGGMGKLVGGLLIAALLVVAIAFAIGSSQGGSSVKLSPVDGDSTGKVTDQMNTLIDDNTR